MKGAAPSTVPVDTARVIQVIGDRREAADNGVTTTRVIVMPGGRDRPGPMGARRGHLTPPLRVPFIPVVA